RLSEIIRLQRRTARERASASGGSLYAPPNALSPPFGLGQNAGPGHVRPGLQTIEVTAHRAAQPPFPTARVDQFPPLKLPCPATEAAFARHRGLPLDRSLMNRRRPGVHDARPDAWSV